MIALTHNGEPLPPALTSNVLVELDILVGGVAPLQTAWSVWTGVEIASGTGPRIKFLPVAPTTTYIDVMALDGAGVGHRQSFTVQVFDRPTTVLAWITWGKARYSRYATMDATIHFSSPPSNRYRSLAWTLYRNGSPISSGHSVTVRHVDVDHGVYHLRAEIVDYSGNTIIAESFSVVTGDFELQATLQPTPGLTMQLLGSVYTGEQIGPSLFSTGVGMQVSAQQEEVYLLPGTTHFQVELESGSSAPGQVIVRTPTGNWSVKGESPRSIDLPYEFLDNSSYIPAPEDLRLQLSCESFAVSVGPQPTYNFRVRIRCFYGETQVYRFVPCDRASSVGGAGLKARRFSVLFSDIDFVTDADTSQARLGGTALFPQGYSTPLPEFLPIVLSTDGSPDASKVQTRMFYTDQNWIATYDPKQFEALEVDAHSTYALDGSRPFSLCFMMPAYPTIVQKPRRIYGTVAVYMANGFVNAGASVTLELLVAGGYATRIITVPIEADASSLDQQSYVKIGEAAVDITEEVFSDTGIVGTVTLDETGADQITWPVADTRPDPVAITEAVYSVTAASQARLDGACYTNSGVVVEMTGTSAMDATGTVYPMVEDIVGCFDPKCGPVGLYCYGEYNGTATLHIPQPLYYPAPYAALANQVTSCYCNPCLLETWVGTNGTLPDYSPFVTYQNGSLCGIPWGYQACNGRSEAIVVPYPVDTAPHDYLSYAGTCYGVTGSLPYTTGYAPVYREDTSPVYDCEDAICTGSASDGMVVRYQDYETSRDVDVYMDHLDSGVPFYAVIRETYNDGVSGLVSGSARIMASKVSNSRLLCVVAGSGKLDFVMSETPSEKRVTRTRSGSGIVFRVGAKATSMSMDVLPGDRIEFSTFAVKNTMVDVKWAPRTTARRHYASGAIVVASTTIRAVGFASLTDRSEYSFYGTLPAVVESSEANLNGFLTVESQGVEYALVHARSLSEPISCLPINVVWYAQQVLQGPLTFKLYAGASGEGHNGDLDVWLDTAGEFPDAMAVSDYKCLVKNGSPPPTNRVPEVERNSLKVIPLTEVPQHVMPSVYTSSDGDRIVVANPDRPPVIVYGGRVYSWRGVSSGYAYSVAEVETASPTHDYDYFLSLSPDDGLIYPVRVRTDSGRYLEIGSGSSAFVPEDLHLISIDDGVAYPLTVRTDSGRYLEVGIGVTPTGSSRASIPLKSVDDGLTYYVVVRTDSGKYWEIVT